MDFNFAGPWNGIPRRVLPPVLASSPPPATILMVEDEALVRVLGAAMLTDAGFRVVEVGDSDEALEFLESDSDVQLLFTDVSLPGAIDGLALARQVHERWPRIGIIVVSGKSLARPDELPAGGRFYRKPYDEAALVRHAHELTAA
jgi:two-component system, response regulator PdtaR